MTNHADRPIRVVHIEDNPDNRFLIQLILEDYCHLESYESGPEGLKAMRDSAPDVVLLDISLPGMDGEQVLEEIRSDAKLSDLPVIALTAHAMRGDRSRFLALGFNEYLTKPILDEELLLDAIRRCSDE